MGGCIAAHKKSAAPLRRKERSRLGRGRGQACHWALGAQGGVAAGQCGGQGSAHRGQRAVCAVEPPVAVRTRTSVADLSLTVSFLLQHDRRFAVIRIEVCSQGPKNRGLQFSREQFLCLRL